MLDKYQFTPITYTLHCLKKHSYKVILLFLDPLFMAIFAVLPSYILKNIVYGFSVADSYEHLIFLIKDYIFVYFFVFFIGLIFWRLYDYFIDIKTFPAIRKEIIIEVFCYTIQQTKDFFQKNYSGELSEKIDELQDNVIQIIEWFFGKIMFNLLSIIFIISALLYFNKSCGYITIAWSILIIVMSYFFASRIANVSIKWVNNSSLLNGMLVDIFSHSLIVKLFNNYTFEKKIISQQTEKIRSEEAQIKWYFFLGWLIYSVSFLIVQISSFYILLMQYKEGKLTSGDFAFVWTINGSLVTILWRFLRDFSLLPKFYFSIEESLRILTQKIDILNKKNNALIISKGKIEFENVTFGFDNTIIFDNLSITIEPGQKIGLVGFSGSGKTTFINLLLRLYEIKNGRIMIDEQDISLVSLSSLYNAITLIPQESGLFHRTILENIVYAVNQDEKSEKDIKEAIDFAFLNEFIYSLPEGAHTPIGERGSRISGGQKQRIAIARALYKNPEILILDEATSSLDTEAEQIIQKTLNELKAQGKTMIVIAHRLSTIANSDKILVMKEGKIMEEGTHRDLLSIDSAYKSMWEKQIISLN